MPLIGIYQLLTKHLSRFFGRRKKPLCPEFHPFFPPSPPALYLALPFPFFVFSHKKTSRILLCKSVHSSPYLIFSTISVNLSGAVDAFFFIEMIIFVPYYRIRFDKSLEVDIKNMGEQK